MPFFNPPTRDEVVYYGEPIFNMMRPTARGINVFVLTDGSVTDIQPSSWDEVSVVYYGGHRTSITQTEADTLTGAGYGSYIEA